MSGTTAAKRIFAILETRKDFNAETQSTSNLPASNLPASSLPPSSLPFSTIHFHEVSYTYPDAPQPALKSLSLTLEAGRHIALVGPSGAGKSTVAQLLLRFLEPTAGEIRLDDRPLQNLSPAEWRRQVAWMPQQPYLFHGSIADNLRLGAPQAGAAEIEAAARRADLHDFIAGLPDGYATRIGERGLRLSGGEAQRLALARAFLKNAPLLILDEPTSHIDPDQERQIQETLAQWMTGRTVLTIAHRLATAARADWIWVLEEGRLIESGSPADLLTHGGWYARWAKEA
jgi:ABC-type multidrug transport system fused ATPase/permease subunit